MSDKVQQEISLIDLWQILVEQKKIIAVIWVVSVALGLAYALLATPIYKAEAFMLPPSQKDIQPLNLPVLEKWGGKGDVDPDRQSDVAYQPSDVYDLFVQSLKSRSNRRSFYKTYHIEEKLGFDGQTNPNVFFEEAFNKKLIVTRNVKKQEESGFVSLSFEGVNAELAAQWVNDFIEETSQVVSKSLTSSVKGQVDALKLSIQETIIGKIKLAKIRREDRIQALQEALTVSESLNDQDQQLKSGKLAVNTGEIPLYMLSASALKAEIDVLKSRKNDAPFIDGLRDLEETLATLEQVDVDWTKVKPVFIDQKAFVPPSPIKPKKTLTVILAALFGLMLGVVLAFLSHAVRKKGVH